MVREAAISVYLSIFRILFNFLKILPQKRKTVFVASFGGNVLCAMDELEKQTDEQIVVLKTVKSAIDYGYNSNRILLDFDSSNLVSFLKSIYHLATARYIIADNYYGFLAVTNFKSNVKCIQLWHAAGAIKQFGLKDLSIKKRPDRAYRRFKQVYNRFDHVVVGSEKMAAIFNEGFGLAKETFLRTGVPRTDFFFSESKIKNAQQSLRDSFPIVENKKVILYAPTYRDNDLQSPKLMLDLEKMYRELKYDYVLFLRLHPAVDGTFENKYPGFIYNVTNYPSVNKLLTITDILITDYSSIPFEFSLLNKPMIFYAYDIEEYSKARGFWETYEELVPGPIAKTTDALIQIIKENNYDIDKISKFAAEWNEYSVGRSTKNLIKTIYRTDQNQSTYKVRVQV
ncbi:CDP-glycerol glycerophosphotransferase family protein [Virgibacillus sp. W0181]|uniref:CDP-glycerol glycerophosphotransferase family protein n=1 Tax=Virgibacillus sp. W0181 TaxID=3391581 RepID=UPI003F4874B5